MKFTSDDPIIVAAEADEEWMRILERQELLKHMPRRMLETHLSLLGWYPVAATRAALQRGKERVYIIELQDKTSVGYSEFSKLQQIDGAWHSIKLPYLRLLADKTAEHP